MSICTPFFYLLLLVECDDGNGMAICSIQETFGVSVLPFAPLIFLVSINCQLNTPYNQLSVKPQGTEELPRSD